MTLVLLSTIQKVNQLVSMEDIRYILNEPKVIFSINLNSFSYHSQDKTKKLFEKVAIEMDEAYFMM